MKTVKTNLEKSENLMKRYGYTLHHYASRRGYCYAGMEGQRERYAGRFGRGWVVIVGKLNGSNNYTQIAYYTK